MRNQGNIQKTLKSESGSVLIIFMILLAILASVAYGALRSTGMNYQTSKAFEKGKESFYAAEAGVDTAIGDIIDEFENLSIYSESEDYPGVDGNGYMTLSDFNGYEVKYKVTNPLDRYLYQTVLGNSVIFHYAYTYEIDSIATQTNGNVTENLKEEFRVLETPLVQYYIFYGGAGNAADLEILPGPTMNSWGRIHANGDIYIGANNAFNLRNYDDNNAQSPHFLSAAGEIFLRRKNNSSTYPANRVNIKTSGTGTTFSPVVDIDQNITSANEAAQEALFNDYVAIHEQVFQAPGKTQFVRGGFYEGRAEDPQRPDVQGLKIVGTGGVGTGIEIWVSEPNYHEVTDLVRDGELSDGTVVIPAGSAVRETLSAFCDAREGPRNVDFTDIDLYFLETWYQAYMDEQGVDYSNGMGILMYASRSPNAGYTNDDSNLQAIRLMGWNGGTVKQLRDETTLTTDNPLYVQGDFNVVNTRGVALVSDAINLLSNAFTTRTCGTRPNANDTTYYAAFFGGNVPTPGLGVGPYSGGLENYPRFHESWSGDTAWIRGCFINLWTSSQARGVWGQSNVYSPPGREWGWDVRFQDPNFWPPFIPSVFSVERAGFLNKNS